MICLMQIILENLETPCRIERKTAISKPYRGGEVKIATKVEMTSTPLDTNDIEKSEKPLKSIGSLGKPPLHNIL